MTTTDPPTDHEKRTSSRIYTTVPLSLGDAKGISRDISASGVFFETDVAYVVGSEIGFTIDFDAAGVKLRFNCQGTIVRVEPKDTRRVGVAVRIVSSSMETID